MSPGPKEVADLQITSNQTMLYERYNRAIFAYLRLHLNSLEDAEDLLLEVFVAALENDNLSSFSSREQLAWLRKVAHNKLINTYRTRQRRPQVPLDTVVETMLEEMEPEQVALRQEETRELQAYIQKLPVLQQQILQLRYSSGLGCADIALLLNKREEAIRKNLSRSVLFLRQFYQ